MPNENYKEKMHVNLGKNDSKLWGFSKLNYVIFLVGLTFILIGYLIMATGDVYSFQSLTFAPVLLFLGYIVLIPLSLIIDKIKR